MTSSATATSRIQDRAREMGFSLVGVTNAFPSEHGELYQRWLGDGYHGEMGYLARDDAVLRREDLELTMDSIQSVVVVGHEYFGPTSPEADDPAHALIARYALGRDYHNVVKKKLLGLLRWIRLEIDPNATGRAYVDTGPILERELGRRAGLGWFGKNTMLIDPKRGSFFFLGCLLLDLELEANAPFGEDHCGSCTRCLYACPTGALLGRNGDGAPLMDARRCISYLTIEHRGPIPAALRPLMGNRVYGCDICQDVCPWNEKFARPTEEIAYRAREGLDGPTLVELAERLLNVDDAGFRDMFRGSPIKRARRAGLLRNVCVALGNWGTREAVPTLARALSDPATLVRSHAAWALGEIGSRGAIEALRTGLGVERDPSVREEFGLALAQRTA